jgi:hypothetical protein
MLVHSVSGLPYSSIFPLTFHSKFPNVLPSKIHALNAAARHISISGVTELAWRLVDPSSFVPSRLSFSSLEVSYSRPVSSTVQYAHFHPTLRKSAPASFCTYCDPFTISPHSLVAQIISMTTPITSRILAKDDSGEWVVSWPSFMTLTFDLVRPSF